MPPKENPERACEECIHFFACSKHCGGRMTLVDFYSYSRDYPILKNGRPSKHGKKCGEEAVGVINAQCNSCHVTWDDSNTRLTVDGKIEIRGDGYGW